MKKLILTAVFVTTLSGCFGYTASDSELVGQAKKIIHQTPLICPDYYILDVSLGVMQNGVGSMSSEDMWLVIDDVQNLKKIQEAVDKNALVKVKYDTKRVAICTKKDVATSFEIKPIPVTQ